jgi:hypothetical protein
MSTVYVEAYRTSEEHKKHVEVLAFCRERGVSLPRETAAYFGDDADGIDPEAFSVEDVEERLRLGSVRIGDGDVRPFGNISAAPVDREMCVGVEISLQNLPPDTKWLRCYVHH